MAYYKEIINRIDRLRERMKRHNLDFVIVTSNDDHLSEYTGDYYKVREYLTGFNGSAGNLIVTATGAYLWTDGRYFTQAAAQIAGSGIELMKMGLPGVATIPEFLALHVRSGNRIGFDATTVSVKFYNQIIDAIPSSVEIEDDFDPARHVWLDRPARSRESIWMIPEEISGKNAEEKIELIRGEMIEKKADYYCISTLDDICWLFNFRGGDIAYTPVVLAFAIVTKNEVRLYVQTEAVDSSIMNYLSGLGVVVCSYNRIYQDLDRLEGYSVYLDPTMTTQAVYKASNKCRIIEGRQLTAIHKACKNKNEREGMRIANINDSIAFTRFLYWIKNNVGKKKITEISAANMLRKMREESPFYLDDSFETIMAYGEHSAIIHYEPSDATDVEIEPEGLLLLDAGAHYSTGTTDMTRTISMGPVSDEMKHNYTLVLKGHLALMDTIFPEKTTGLQLDVIARQYLWREGLNFRHGTGHGVGSILCVHEGPMSISNSKTDATTVELKRGMIISDEPGFYVEGQYGIRIESLLTIRKAEETEYGQFYRFMPLACVPFDRELIDVSMLTDIDILRLNDYHSFVRDNTLDYFEGDERTWLLAQTESFVR